MSKSLKNFITIKEYLNNYSNTILNRNITNNTNSVDTHKIHNSDRPSLDFRIFCLQHKYDSSIHFSSAKISEAKIFREKIDYFLKLYRSVLSVSVYHQSNNSRNNNSRNNKKKTTRSAQLQTLLSQTQVNIHESLCNDYDTPSVVRSLATLIDDATV